MTTPPARTTGETIFADAVFRLAKETEIVQTRAMTSALRRLRTLTLKRDAIDFDQHGYDKDGNVVFECYSAAALMERKNVIKQISELDGSIVQAKTTGDFDSLIQRFNSERCSVHPAYTTAPYLAP